MRIISGALGGRQIKAPRGSDTRPTTDRARESIFNLLASRAELRDSAVLDLFSGSGALGFEALSRGAKSVLFVDNHAGAMRISRENAEELGILRQCRFLRADARRFVERGAYGEKFNIVFADPPYELPGLSDLPALVLPILSPGGVFVLEHDLRVDFEDHPHLDTSRAYGRTIVTIFGSLPHGED